MNKDQIAIYLNEHPEFFNDYPELLQKFKQIDHEDLPLQPLKTLSIADRILKRANDDKEHMRSQLEWFVEITQANEEIQEHLFEIERAIMSHIDLSEMIRQLKDDILTRFVLEKVQICLSENPEHLIESNLVDPEGLKDTLHFVSPEKLEMWFPKSELSTLNGELQPGASVFVEGGDDIRSQALIPIHLRGKLAGAICLGSREPFHFHEGLRTDYLVRMAEKLGLAIDNILLLDSLRRQPVLDKQTGLFNASYLKPVLAREFDRARRYNKQLSIIKMHIDTPSVPGDTESDSRQEVIFKEVGRVLAESSRGGDSIVRTEPNEFLMLLPGLENQAAVNVAERIRSALESFASPNGESTCLECRFGVSSFAGDSMCQPTDLIQLATRALSQARQNGKRVVTC